MSKNIDLIFRAGLCVSCGACVNICPNENIRMAYDGEREKYDARVLDPAVCGEGCGEENCLRVCPSYEVDFVAVAEANLNNGLGRIEAVYTGTSAGPGEAARSSTAGVTRRIVRELIDRGEIDGIIALTHDEGLDFTPKIVTDTGLMPNSIYHNVNYEAAICLIEKTEGRFVIIALPCQLAGMVQYFNVERKRRFAERVALKIALICGHTFPRTGIRTYARRNGITKILDVGYRGKTKKGKITLTHPNGEYEADRVPGPGRRKYVDFQLLFHPLLAQKRCLCCVDHLGYLADLVIGDAWLARFSGLKQGINLIAARTPAGKAALLATKGLHLEEASADDLFEAQGQYALGLMGEHFLRRAERRHQFAPRFNRGRLELSEYKPSLSGRLLLWAREKLPSWLRTRFQVGVLTGVFYYRHVLAYHGARWLRRTGISPLCRRWLGRDE